MRRNKYFSILNISIAKYNINRSVSLIILVHWIKKKQEILKSKQ